MSSDTQTRPFLRYMVDVRRRGEGDQPFLSDLFYISYLVDDPDAARAECEAEARAEAARRIGGTEGDYEAESVLVHRKTEPDLARDLLRQIARLRSLKADFDPTVDKLAFRRRGVTFVIPVSAVEVLVSECGEDTDVFGFCLRCGSEYGECGVGYCEHDDTDEED